MDKKLLFKPGLCYQIYLSVFISVAVIISIGILIILAAVNRDIETIIQAFIAIAIGLGAVWFIFSLVLIFKRSVLEVNEKGIVKKTKKKILWEFEWGEIEKMEYRKMTWFSGFEAGSYGWFEITGLKEGKVNKKSVNLFYREIKKIMNESNKEIKIYK